MSLNSLPASSLFFRETSDFRDSERRASAWCAGMGEAPYRGPAVRLAQVYAHQRSQLVRRYFAQLWQLCNPQALVPRRGETASKSLTRACRVDAPGRTNEVASWIMLRGAMPCIAPQHEVLVDRAVNFMRGPAGTAKLKIAWAPARYGETGPCFAVGETSGMLQMIFRLGRLGLRRSIAADVRQRCSERPSALACRAATAFRLWRRQSHPWSGGVMATPSFCRPLGRATFASPSRCLFMTTR